MHHNNATASILPVLSHRGQKPLRLALVLPCYNESAVLGITIPRLDTLLTQLQEQGLIGSDSFVVFVDDGSRDGTWTQIEGATKLHYGRFRGVRLAANVGHQYALLAGLEYVTGKCDAAISIDADLQDDLDAIPRMLDKHREGAEIVLGVKETRADDSAFKTGTALGFYKLMKFMGVELVENHADFRFLSARALRNLSNFPEYHLFLRGLPPLLHQRVAMVHYKLAPRPAGESKYPIRKMLALAWNGITSFSVVPLRLISYAGGLVFLISLGFAAYAFLETLAGKTLPGWASITVPLYLLGGMIMLSIGVVGEYVGKLFFEVKRRPRFLVDTIVGEDIQHG